MKKVGVILAGCGVFDGSEIHEATLTLFFLDRQGVEIVYMAPDVDQSDVIDHSTHHPMRETRNVIVESSRISRGNIKNIKDLTANDMDALIIPGGLGAAKNLCNFSSENADCTAHPEIERLILGLSNSKKPIGFICIAPVICAKVLGKIHPQVSIGRGDENNLAAAIKKMGGVPVECDVDDIIVDRANRIISTPAYLLGPSISQIALGIEKLVLKVLEMIDN